MKKFTDEKILKIGHWTDYCQHVLCGDCKNFNKNNGKYFAECFSLLKESIECDNRKVSVSCDNCIYHKTDASKCISCIRMVNLRDNFQIIKKVKKYKWVFHDTAKGEFYISETYSSEEDLKTIRPEIKAIHKILESEKEL